MMKCPHISCLLCNTSVIPNLQICVLINPENYHTLAHTHARADIVTVIVAEKLYTVEGVICQSKNIQKDTIHNVMSKFSDCFMRKILHATYMSASFIGRLSEVIQLSCTLTVQSHSIFVQIE